MEKLGYELSEDDVSKVYESFKSISAKKESVSARELDTIVASVALQVPPTYRLQSYVINCGNLISASAHLTLRKGEENLEGICLGGNIRINLNVWLYAQYIFYYSKYHY